MICMCITIFQSGDSCGCRVRSRSHGNGGHSARVVVVWVPGLHPQAVSVGGELQLVARVLLRDIDGVAADVAIVVHRWRHRPGDKEARRAHRRNLDVPRGRRGSYNEGNR